MKTEYLDRNCIIRGGNWRDNLSSSHRCKEGPSAIGEKLCLAQDENTRTTGTCKHWNFSSTQQQNSSPLLIEPICIYFHIYIYLCTELTVTLFSFTLNVWSAQFRGF